VGLTGGIGSGKSTVAQLLVDQGAVLVDADRIVRELQEPGQAVYAAMVAHFGDGIVAEDASLNRPAIAEIVFNDADRLKELNDIVHPAVTDVVVERLAALAETDSIVVQDIPLLVESGRTGFSGVIVVDCPADVAVERLVSHRGFSEEDARARIASQASREDRLAIADRVVDNSGDLVHLEAQISQVWEWMQTLEDADSDITASEKKSSD